VEDGREPVVGAVPASEWEEEDGADVDADVDNSEPANGILRRCDRA
jgi:hypothetical protein